jgi:hypothetical protein
MATYHPQMSDKEASECLKTALDNQTGAFSMIDGFLTQKVGRSVVVEYTDGTKDQIASVTFKDGATTLWVIEVTAAATTDTFTRTA